MYIFYFYNYLLVKPNFYLVYPCNSTTIYNITQPIYKIVAETKLNEKIDFIDYLHSKDYYFVVQYEYRRRQGIC